MRRVGIAIGVIVLLCCALALSSWVWVSRAVAQVEPSTICLSQRHRSQIEDRTFPPRQQDIIVTKTMNFNKGEGASRWWWHLRGAAIHWTYLAFWQRGERAIIFDRLAAQMKTCPAGRGSS
jgi:hypothetical protein